MRRKSKQEIALGIRNEITPKLHVLAADLRGIDDLQAAALVDGARYLLHRLADELLPRVSDERGFTP